MEGFSIAIVGFAGIAEQEFIKALEQCGFPVAFGTTAHPRAFF